MYSPLWSALSEENFRRSVVYEVTVVQIFPSEAPRVAPPVEERRVFASLARRPTIERVFGKSRVDARSFVLSNTQRGPPWPPHFLLAPHLVGVARV